MVPRLYTYETFKIVCNRIKWRLYWSNSNNRNHSSVHLVVGGKVGQQKKGKSESFHIISNNLFEIIDAQNDTEKYQVQCSKN